jgi:hypothetical protein
MKKLIILPAIVLFLQSMNGQNVGIGTSSPNATLHVKYSVASTPITNPLLILDNPTGGIHTSMQFQINGVETGRFRSSNDGTMTYSTAGIGNHMFKNGSDGNEILTIDGSNSSLVIDPAELNIGNITNGVIKFGGTTSTEGIGSKRSTGNNQYGLDFYTNSSARMSITYGGNVGIGTTAPDSKLHVRYASANTNAQSPVFILDNPSGGTQTSLQFRLNGVETGRIRSDLNNNLVFATVGVGDHVFRSSADLSDLMIINGASGNVGIGTTSPVNKLTVDGNTNFTGRAGIGTTNLNAILNVSGVGTEGTAVFYGTNNASNFNYGVDNSEDTYIRGGKTTSRVVINDASSGHTIIASGSSKVGIGTTSPAYKLTVQNTVANAAAVISSAEASNIISASASGAEAAVYASTYAGSSVSHRWAFGKDDDAESSSNNGSNFFINRYDDNGVYINRAMVIKRDNGYVAIGGAFNPDQQLHVMGTTKTTNLQITNGASNGYVLQSDGSGNASWVNANTLTVTETDPQVSSSLTNYVPKWNGTTLTDGILYDNGSSVGIGTSSPSGRLHVYNGSGNSVVNIQSASNSAYVNLNAGASGMESSIAAFTSGSQRWSFGKSNSAESGSDAGSDFFINRYNDAGAFQSQPIVIKRSTGHVGINQGNPGYQLDVNGNVNISSSNGYYIGNAKVLSNSGTDNLFAGVSAGASATGNNNTAIGVNTLNTLTTGNYNTALGSGAGIFSTGSNNLLLGAGAGALVGSNNIIIGFGAGGSESGSNKLYIDNSNTSSPLIYGDFSSNAMTVNGTLSVEGALGLNVKTTQVAGTNNPDASGGVWFYSSGTGTITLPSASSVADRVYIILNNTGASRTISSYLDLSNTAQTFIANNTSLWIISDGTSWRQIK